MSNSINTTITTTTMPTTTAMETPKVQPINGSDDTDDQHTDDDITISATTTTTDEESNSMNDGEDIAEDEYPMDDISLIDEDEDTVAAKIAGHDGDADNVTPAAPSLARSIVNALLFRGALKPNTQRQSNPQDREQQQGSDYYDYNEDCSIKARDISRTSDSIQSMPVEGASTLEGATTLEDDVKELRSHVHATRTQRARTQQSAVADVDADATQHDPDLALRLKDFHHARHLRSETYRTAHCGIFCNFVMLAGARLDLAWAEDAAWRREQGKPFFSWVDFEHGQRKKFHPCPFTYLIMIVSTVTLVLSMSLNGWKFAPLKVNPMFGPDTSVLIDMGGLLTSKIVEENEWYRLVSSLMLHAGIIHYVINMLVFWCIGTAVERVHGTMETAAVFMLSGVGGNLASANFMLNSVSVGASAGLFGLLGFCLADVLTNWDLLTITDSRTNTRFPYVSTIFWLSIDVVSSLGFGLVPFIDNFAHLGGFLFGVCFGLSLLWRSGSSAFFGRITLARHYRNYAYAVIGAVVATCVFTAMVVLLLDSDGRTTVCPRCRYLSCAPFPFWTNDPWWNCDDCDQALVSIVRLRNASELDLTCPNGDIVTIGLMNPDPDRDDIRSQIIGYCRQLC